MTETTTIDVLRIARNMAKDRLKGIGEPLLSISSDQLFVREKPDGKVELHLRADYFITVAEEFCSTPSRKELGE